MSRDTKKGNTADHVYQTGFSQSKISLSNRNLLCGSCTSILLLKFECTMQMPGKIILTWLAPWCSLLTVALHLPCQVTNTFWSVTGYHQVQFVVWFVFGSYRLLRNAGPFCKFGFLWIMDVKVLTMTMMQLIIVPSIWQLRKGWGLHKIIMGCLLLLCCLFSGGVWDSMALVGLVRLGIDFLHQFPSISLTTSVRATAAAT